MGDSFHPEVVLYITLCQMLTCGSGQPGQEEQCAAVSCSYFRRSHYLSIKNLKAGQGIPGLKDVGPVIVGRASKDR